MNGAEIGKFEHSADEVLKGKISIKLYFASLYFITSGILYLWGFWPSFGVNILEFLDITDILKSTAYPIVAAVLFLIIGGALGHKLATSRDKSGSRRLEADFDAVSPEQLTQSQEQLMSEKAKLKRQLRYIKAGYLLVTIPLLLAALAGWSKAWLVVPMLLSLPCALWLSFRPLVKLFTKDENHRYLVSFLLAAIPLYAYGAGRISSDNIKSGSSYYFVISDLLGHPGDAPSTSLRYVGHAGSYVFFFEPKEQGTVMLKLKDDKPLILKEHKEQISMWDALRDFSTGCHSWMARLGFGKQ